MTELNGDHSVPVEIDTANSDGSVFDRDRFRGVDGHSDVDVITAWVVVAWGFNVTTIRSTTINAQCGGDGSMSVYLDSESENKRRSSEDFRKHLFR